jgi:signal transduction histidine kinase
MEYVRTLFYIASSRPCSGCASDIVKNVKFKGFTGVYIYTIQEYIFTSKFATRAFLQVLKYLSIIALQVYFLKFNTTVCTWSNKSVAVFIKIVCSYTVWYPLNFSSLMIARAETKYSGENVIQQISEKLLKYKRKWMQHVNRMPRNRLPRVMKHYFPTGRRNHGRPLKRLLDTWDRNGSTSDPTPWQIYDDDDDDDNNDVIQTRCVYCSTSVFYVISWVDE